jgi:hypothetical protein
MKRLGNNQRRCSGRYSHFRKDTCPKRDSCLRYLHYSKYDLEGRDESYRSAKVEMAEVGCKIFVEAD